MEAYDLRTMDDDACHDVDVYDGNDDVYDCDAVDGDADYEDDDDDDHDVGSRVSAGFCVSISF